MAMTKRQLVGKALKLEGGKSEAKIGDAMQFLDRVFDILEVEDNDSSMINKLQTEAFKRMNKPAKVKKK